MEKSTRKRRFVFATAGVVLGWALIELAAVASGALVPQSFRDQQRLLHEFFEPDTDLGFRAKPNLRDFEIEWSESGESAAYSTDSDGFRNVGRDVAKARILFVGDSFTWGVWLPREQTFPDLIEQQLGVPIANWGRESYYIEQYALLADQFLDAFDPDIVAICIYANDLTAPISSEQLANFYDEYGWNNYRRYPLWKGSILYQAWQQASDALAAGSAPPSHLDFKQSSNGLRLYRGVGAHPHYESAGYDEAIEAKYLSMLRSIRAAGATPVVFLLPSKESTYFAEYTRLFGSDYLAIEERAYASLGKIAAGLGVEALDLTHAFRAQRDGPPGYLRIDPHWNAAGHRQAAQSMEPVLRRALRLGP